MAVKHLRFDIFGTLCGGAEVWSCGYSTQPLASGTPDLDTMAVTALTRFDTDFWGQTGVLNVMSPQVALSGCKATSFNAAGVVDGTATAVLSTPHAGTAGGASTQLPPQCSVVLSLRTPISGARGRGRMYLPAPCSLELTSTGRLLTEIRDGWADKLQDMIDTINSDPTMRPVAVASSVGGFVTSVTEIRVGNVVDTQRRRRDNLPESYASRTITI